VNRILAVASLLLALAAPAAATESIVCASEDNSASIDVLVGLGLDVISVDRVTVEVKDKTWATNADGEQKIVVGQAFEDGEKLILDLTAEGMAPIVASLRLFKVSEGEDYASGGTLKVVGVGAWAVTCSGP
jgi:hypothetical protein